MKIRIIIWNIRGLGVGSGGHVNDLCGRWKLDVISIQETKMVVFGHREAIDKWGRR